MNRIPGRIVVELDDEASELLREHLAGNSFFERQKDDPRDVVNAGIAFLLGDPDENCCSLDVLKRVRAHRLAMEGGKAVTGVLGVPVVLDRVAGKLAVQMAIERGWDPRDVVNGSIVCLLTSWLFDECIDSEDAVEQAATRRLAKERKEAA